MNQNNLTVAAHFFMREIVSQGGQISFLSAIDEKQHSAHDIDCIIDLKALRCLPKVFDQFREKSGFQLVQAIKYDVSFSMYCVFAKDTVGCFEYIKMDFLYDPDGVGCYGISSNIMLSKSKLCDSVIVPEPFLELAYQISKRSSKARVEHGESFEKIERLFKLSSGFLPETYEIIKKVVPRWYFYEFIRRLQLGPKKLNELLCFGRLIAAFFQLVSSPRRFCMRGIGEFRRFLTRCCAPVGLVVQLDKRVFSAESEFINELKQRLSIPFRGKFYFVFSNERLSGMYIWYLLIKGYLIFDFVDIGRKKRKCGNSLFFCESVVAQVTEKQVVNFLSLRAEKYFFSKPS